VSCPVFLLDNVIRWSTVVARVVWVQATGSRKSTFELVRILTDVMQKLFAVLIGLCPPSDIVARLLFLQAFEYLLVLKSDLQ